MPLTPAGSPHTHPRQSPAPPHPTSQVAGSPHLHLDAGDRQDLECRPMRAASSPMQGGTASSSTATGSKGKRLRLVECPRCGVRVITIRSKQAETYGEVFFKCPNNIKEDPRTCGFIRSEEQYESYLRGLDAQQDLEATGEEGHCFGDGNTETRKQCFELKQEIDLMKQQLHVALVDICNLKMQRNEIKKVFGMDTSVAVAVCVGVVIGMLVTAMWKSNE